MNPKKQHLKATPIIESDHASVKAFVHKHVGGSSNPRNRQSASIMRSGMRFDTIHTNLNFP